MPHCGAAWMVCIAK